MAPKNAKQKREKKEKKDTSATNEAADALFVKIDKDGNQSIDKEELLEYLLGVGQEPESISSLFGQLDVDGDGKITKEEFQQGYAIFAQIPELSPGEMEAKKVLAEIKQDGVVHKKEWAGLIRDKNDELGLIDSNDYSSYIKKEWAEATENNPNEKQLSADQFKTWYASSFYPFMKGILDEREAKEAAKEAAKAASMAAAQAQFKSDGLWEVDLKEYINAIQAAFEKKKTPIVIDATVGDGEGATTPLETFFQYSGNALAELKKTVVEVNMKKTVTLEDGREELRKKLVLAMGRGLHFVMLLANSAPPFTSKFSDKSSLPMDILDQELVQACRGSEADWQKMWPGSVVTEEDKKEQRFPSLMVHKDFNVVVVTKFSVEDYADFLKEEFPLDKMQPIKVTSAA